MTRRESLRDWLLGLRSRPRRLAAVVLLVLGVAGLALADRAWRTCGFAGCPDVSRLTAGEPGDAPPPLDRPRDRQDEPSVPTGQETVLLHTLPTQVVQGFLAVEDKRFHEHHGVDWRRIGGAMIANLRAGSFAQGFSTITMQLARHLLPAVAAGAEHSFSRELLEMRVAREIEARFSKEEILGLYLNHIDFGHGTRGIGAAARHYFDRPASQLTLSQAALLAALAKSPAAYDPHQHPEAARRRRDLVLALLVQQGRVPYKEADVALALPLAVVPAPLVADRGQDDDRPARQRGHVTAEADETPPVFPGDEQQRSLREAERFALELELPTVEEAGVGTTGPSGADLAAHQPAPQAWGESAAEPELGRPTVEEAAGRAAEVEDEAPAPAPGRNDILEDSEDAGDIQDVEVTEPPASAGLR
jgi:Transglycosylase